MTNFYTSIKISIIFIIGLFLSKELFSYDFEKVVISSILFFLIILYQGSYDILYNLFFLKSLKYKEEYLELITIKKKVEKKLYNFIIAFFKKENLIIMISNYIFSNLNLMFKSLYQTRKLLISFLNKIKLNSIINFYLKTNKIRKLILLNLFLYKLTILLNSLHYKIDKKNLNVKYKTLNIIYMLLNLNANIEFSHSGKIWYTNQFYLVFLLENNLK